MQKTLLVLKPSITNAVLPVSVKYFLRAAVFSLILYGIFYAMQSLGIREVSRDAVPWFVAIALALTMAPLAARMFILYHTRYYFYPTHVASEFRFFRVKRLSAPYNQIVNVNTSISLWDRFSGAGDIILHTAENNSPNLVLSYIRNPRKVEGVIYRLMQRHSPQHAGQQR